MIREEHVLSNLHTKQPKPAASDSAQNLELDLASAEYGGTCRKGKVTFTQAYKNTLRSPREECLPTDTSRKILLLALLVAALVRTILLIWEYKHGLTIDSEGAEYCRLAENLRSGHGYMGMFNNGTQLNFPPLFPLLIAALSYIVPGTELAVRLISMVLGSLLVVPMSSLANRIYGRRVAFLVAVLVIFHPLLVARSVLGCSETSYLTIFVSGVYLVIRFIEDLRVGTAVLAGLLFGLAYLVRPEVFIFVAGLAAAGLISLFFVQRRRPVAMGVMSLVSVFALAASPYVAFLSISSGKFRVEAKGSLVYAWGTKMNAGMTYTEAATKIGENLSAEGVFMKSNYETLNTTPHTLRNLISYVLHSAPRSLRTIYSTIATSQSNGAPVLFVLAVIGLFRTVWDRRRLVEEGILLLAGFMMVLALLPVTAFWPRYFHSFMALLLLWGGKGADELYHWSHDTVASILQKDVPKRVGLTVQGIAIFLVFALSLWGVLGENEFRESMHTDRKTAGVWLAQHAPGPKWVMDTSLIPAYYAGGNLMYLPFCSSDVAVRYIVKKRPNFIVLLEYPKNSLPYLAQWFDQGIPDKRAELIYDQGSGGHERIKIYHWNDDPAQNQ
jgi:4-amino-4-deoxy-L-arabinose transferase-like glycosyltransferase